MSGVGDKSLITHIRHDGRHGIHRTTNMCGRPSDLGGDANRLDETSLTHAKMGDELLGDGDSLSLIAEATDGIAVGFAEIAVRKYANGCDTRPVAFLEGVLGQTAIQAARYWSTANSTRGNVASSTRVSRTWIRYVDRRMYVASGSFGMGIF